MTLKLTVLAMLVSLLGIYIAIEVTWLNKRLRVINKAKDSMILEKIRIIKST